MDRWQICYYVYIMRTIPTIPPQVTPVSTVWRGKNERRGWSDQIRAMKPGECVSVPAEHYSSYISTFRATGCKYKSRRADERLTGYGVDYYVWKLGDEHGRSAAAAAAGADVELGRVGSATTEDLYNFRHDIDDLRAELILLKDRIGVLEDFMWSHNR